jgi:hypothetical protein
MPTPINGLRRNGLWPTRHPVAWLWGLTLLFLLRVLGQVLVACCQVPFLPPMPHWYSGLLPYPLLLPSQLLILALQVKINRDLALGRGWFQRPRPRLGKALQYFSYSYAGVMVMRYGLTMALYPERRWLGEGTIPIVFHWVLATYLWLWGWSHRRGMPL